MTTIPTGQNDPTDDRAWTKIVERDALGRIVANGNGPRQPRMCPTCGATFDAGRSSSKAYCSDGCQVRYRLRPPAPIDLDLSWQLRGACVGMDANLWFPERGDPSEPGKAICAGCEVRVECLEYALTARETHGTWGGRSERERRGIRRQRNTGREVA